MENLTAAPLSPVTLEEVKRAVDILPDEMDRDDLLNDLLPAAVAVVDGATAHPVVEAQYRFDLPVGSWERWWFPIRPVVSIDAIAVRAEDGTWSAVAVGDSYVAQAAGEPQFVPDATVRAAICAGVDARIDATCGGAVRQQHRKATILILREWLLAGISEQPAKPPDLSFAAETLIRQVRYRRPKVCA